MSTTPDNRETTTSDLTELVRWAMESTGRLIGYGECGPIWHLWGRTVNIDSALDARARWQHLGLVDEDNDLADSDSPRAALASAWLILNRALPQVQSRIPDAPTNEAAAAWYTATAAVQMALDRLDEALTLLDADTPA